ncbi:MAG: DUF1489 domain-containing protein [Pseudomonadota bacterium]
MAASLHLIKLCVGAEKVEDLTRWQETVRARNDAAGRGPITTHVTRMWPKRADALLDGGSIYWVFRGLVLARQHVLALEERKAEDGTRRCALVLDPEVVLTAPQPRRPFQGWRYLLPADAPPDLGPLGTPEADLPTALAADLSRLGVL